MNLPLAHLYLLLKIETDAFFSPTPGTSADVPDVPSNTPMMTDVATSQAIDTARASERPVTVSHGSGDGDSNSDITNHSYWKGTGEIANLSSTQICGVTDQTTLDSVRQWQFEAKITKTCRNKIWNFKPELISCLLK